MEISNGRSDPWLMPFARYGMRERATANVAGCSGVCGENAWAQVEAMNVETLHQAVFFRLALAGTCKRGARKSAQW
ncbi:hypothetical protein A6V36_08965 [Paraburkholderia ginsengiterrae]|uniref:Uncharacterized protein n=1 Tax=Paraburkholderia ginsengiterrae TaxID=1462993 RepID=A0A1A9N844_9BURK|nr:hypothetical protein [Paraburkholderia ginsengiterrae]OAJ54952.1 hypothetical protein A6V36_08965 [Paraburkholderia ginsengiterrae]OAJ61136.1 hypothetical protein A6V37_03300 [Paraburkholderia ginsengiterrae]